VHRFFVARDLLTGKSADSEERFDPLPDRFHVVPFVVLLRMRHFIRHFRTVRRG
jgi:hypothetical protein